MITELATCTTFETAAEAAAFMRGFGLGCASHGGINCEIDEEEPEVILIDFEDAEDHEAYLMEIESWPRMAMLTSGSSAEPSPTEEGLPPLAPPA